MGLTISTVSCAPHLPDSGEARMVWPMSTKEALVAEINEFLAKHNMRAADFGKLVMNDLGFVYRLRQGLDPKSSTIDKCRDFMRDYKSPLARRKNRSEARSAA